eukprot:2716857-Pleurochrysis_carterae.AAC.1
MEWKAAATARLEASSSNASTRSSAAASWAREIMHAYVARRSCKQCVLCSATTHEAHDVEWSE